MRADDFISSVILLSIPTEQFLIHYQEVQKLTSQSLLIIDCPFKHEWNNSFTLYIDKLISRYKDQGMRTSPYESYQIFKHAILVYLFPNRLYLLELVTYIA